MKRFHYDASVGGVVDIAKRIAFGSELVVGPDVMAPTASVTIKGLGSGSGVAGSTATRTKYKFFAAIYHHGVSASGGHYTLDVLHPNRFPGPSSGAGSGAGAGTGAKGREGWIRIDDELVSDVRPEDVFDGGRWAYGYGYGGSMRCAYLLFYRRVR